MAENTKAEGAGQKPAPEYVKTKRTDIRFRIKRLDEPVMDADLFDWSDRSVLVSTDTSYPVRRYLESNSNMKRVLAIETADDRMHELEEALEWAWDNLIASSEDMVDLNNHRKEAMELLGKEDDNARAGETPTDKPASS